MADETWRSVRARLAALRRHHPDQPELVADLQRALKVKHARSYITRMRSESPALTADDLEGLASLLLAPPQEGGEHAPAG